jgi:hypothetical protein
MATVNKSDRKKLVGTQIVGTKVVFMRADTGEEIGRVDVATLTDNMTQQTLIYGVKQIVSDVVAGAEGIEAKVAGMSAAIASLGSGNWPRRPSAPVDMEKTIVTLMATLGETRAQILARLSIEE